MTTPRPRAKAVRSIWKKSGGLRQDMVVHYRGPFMHTRCARLLCEVFATDDRKRVGCKVCLRCMKAGRRIPATARTRRGR